jgi:hypothetical protein
MLIGLWIAVRKITFESLAMCLRGGQEEWETGVFFVRMKRRTEKPMYKNASKKHFP